MGRCRYENLSQIEFALDEIRKLEKLKEPKPGIFYLKSQGFLHFHEKEDKIWADVKDKAGWVSIDVPKKPTKKFLKNFVSLVTNYYEKAL
ncbi:MAG: hypothetical protein K2Q18_17430 [Bdellovibrionales bacterium]|nr:hypothetical protein [Bdellovibrionales bacterium]